MKKIILFFAFIGTLTINNIFAQGGTTGLLTWNISGGSLIISGEGAMPDYGYTGGGSPSAPWYPYEEYISTVVIENGVTSIGNYAFSSCISLTSITIPDGVTAIGNGAFSGCSALTSITIPNGVTSIGVFTFSGCSNLISIILPSSVTSIESYSFERCTALISVNIPNGVTKIGMNVFDNCSSLTSITLSNSVTSIDYGAFYDCSKLTSITSHAIIPPDLEEKVFYNVSPDISVIVPCNSLNTYANSNWNYFTVFNHVFTEVCMVSVDDNNHNQIVWEKNDGAFGYKVFKYDIYREGSVGGQYDLVHSAFHDEPNTWVDTESNAKIRSYRYKIASVIYHDNPDCNSETNMSVTHKTMHLTINAGQNNSWNLIWTTYEGVDYSTYNIYRSSGETIGDMELIGTMPSGNTSFSDFSAPEGYVYYVVEIMLNESCAMDRSFSSIKSNIATNNPGVSIDEMSDDNIKAFPNPVKDELFITSEGKINRVELYNLLGDLMISENNFTEKISTQNIPIGVYLLKIQTEKGIITKKMIKQ